MAKVYWDTNAFIYLFEDHARMGKVMAGIRKRMLARRDQLYTSTFTMGELLVVPFRAGDSRMARAYDEFLRGPAVTLIPFDEQAAAQYALIREDPKISRQDAIHLACASAAGIDLFLTNDAQLLGKIVPGIHFISSLTNAPL